MNSNKLIIHIGIGKTATTAIQEIGKKLYEEDANVCTVPHGIIGGANNGYSANHPLFVEDNLEKLVQEAIDFIKSRAHPSIISSEFLIRQSPEQTARLVNKFTNKKILPRIFVGIRNYTDLMISSYSQAVKTGYGKLKDEQFEDYIYRELNQIRLPELIENWSRLVGDENIYLFDFDRDRNSFVQRFYTIAGLEKEILGMVENNFNKSLPIESTEIVNLFDSLYDDINIRLKIVDALMHLRPSQSMSINYFNTAEKICSSHYARDFAILQQRYKIF